MVWYLVGSLRVKSLLARPTLHIAQSLAWAGSIGKGLAVRTRCCDSIMVNPLREVIAVNQDPLGVQGRLIKSMGRVGKGKNGGQKTKSESTAANYRVYSRPLKNGDVAVALLNVHSFAGPHNITFNFNEVSQDSQA